MIVRKRDTGQVSALTPSKASDASEWSAPMACVGGTASAARLKRPKSSAQRFSASRSLRSTPWQVVVEFVAQTNFPNAEGRMLVARPDFGRCPQHWRPPGAPHRSCSAAMEACAVHTGAAYRCACACMHSSSGRPLPVSKGTVAVAVCTRQDGGPPWLAQGV